MPKLPRQRRLVEREGPVSVTGPYLVPIDQVPRRRAARSTAYLHIPTVTPLVEGPNGVQLTQIHPSHLSSEARRRAYTAQQQPLATYDSHPGAMQGSSHDAVEQPEATNSAADKEKSAQRRRRQYECLMTQTERWTDKVLPLLLPLFLQYLRRWGAVERAATVPDDACTCSSRHRRLRLLVLYYNRQ